MNLIDLVLGLDRCPHGRHEGDVCAGWRGPGDFDGGCFGGYSLGNPGANDLVGHDIAGNRLTAVDLIAAAKAYRAEEWARRQADTP